MPIPNLQNEVPINQYTASNGQTEFSFTFYIFATSDIKVYVNDVLKTITTDYVVRKSDGGAIGSSDLPLDGGKIIFNVGLSSGAKVSLNRDIPVERSTQFTTGGGFFADNLNTELTRILAIQQQITRDIGRSFRLAPSDAEGGSLQLPTNRADNILAFDASGNLILYKLADIDKASVSPYIATLLNDVDANEARTTLNAQQLNSNLTSLSALASIANLSALSGLTGASNKIPMFTGAGAMALTDKINPATTTAQGIVYLNNPIIIANNSGTPNTDIDFTAGNFSFSDGSGQAIAPALTKRLQSSGSWSAGAGGNLLTTGARANSSTYHLYAIYNPTTLATDYMALLGVAGTAPDPTAVLPSGYTKFKRLASILTDGSGNIRTGKYTFFIGGYDFEYNTPITDVSSVSLTTTRASLPITTPAGIKTKANFYIIANSVVNAIDKVIVYEGGTSVINGALAGGVASGTSSFGTTLFCKTNLSKQIDWKTENYTLSMSLATHGFTDFTN